MYQLEHFLSSQIVAMATPSVYIQRRYSSHGNQSTGLFDKPIFSSAEGFHQATEEALIKAKDLVAKISNMGVAHQPSEEVVVKMDELSDVLCKIADLSECVRLLF